MRGNVLRINQPIEIITEECCACGVIYGLTTEYQERRRNDHKSFHCPNGHPQSYLGESEAEKNARLLKEEQARHARTLQRENEERSAKEKSERKLKRVNAGVCHCCNRTFQQLARHMADKHPELVKRSDGALPKGAAPKPAKTGAPKQVSEFDRAKARHDAKQARMQQGESK